MRRTGWSAMIVVALCAFASGSPSPVDASHSVPSPPWYWDLGNDGDADAAVPVDAAGSGWTSLALDRLHERSTNGHRAQTSIRTTLAPARRRYIGTERNRARTGQVSSQKMSWSRAPTRRSGRPTGIFRGPTPTRRQTRTCQARWCAFGTVPPTRAVRRRRLPRHRHARTRPLGPFGRPRPRLVWHILQLRNRHVHDVWRTDEQLR
jgi:hypothetical protein